MPVGTVTASFVVIVVATLTFPSVPLEETPGAASAGKTAGTFAAVWTFDCAGAAGGASGVVVTFPPPPHAARAATMTAAALMRASGETFGRNKITLS